MWLNQALVNRGLVTTKSQADNYINIGLVLVNDKTIKDPSFRVSGEDKIKINTKTQYVSRAGFKLASVAKEFDLNFRSKIVIDVGSSTGGFTDFALKCGAKKVYAVEIGKDQLHSSLRDNPSISLYEQTDIRSFIKPPENIDIILIDVSFVSLRPILLSIRRLCDEETKILAMFKPQFEANTNSLNRGIIKNSKIRRQIVKDFETWLKKNNFFVEKSTDSKISGSKGNLEKFFLLKKTVNY